MDNLGSQHGDPDQLKNLINCFLFHCRAILKILSKSAHNFLNNGRISDWTSQHGDPDCHQILKRFSFYQPESLHKILLQSVHNLLSNVANRQTDRQTNRKKDKPMLPKTQSPC